MRAAVWRVHGKLIAVADSPLIVGNFSGIHLDDRGGRGGTMDCVVAAAGFCEKAAVDDCKFSGINAIVVRVDS